MSQSDHLRSYGSTLATMEILENIWEVVSSYENNCASVGVLWQLLEYDCNPLKTIKAMVSDENTWKSAKIPRSHANVSESIGIFGAAMGILGKLLQYCGSYGDCWAAMLIHRL